MPNKLQHALDWSPAKSHAVFALFVALLVAAHWQPEWQMLLRYERETYLSQLWQSLSHAVVHLNLQHMLLNTIALLCIYLLFPEAFTSPSWIFATAFSAVFSTTGLYYFSPETQWCVGLSGTLHGLIIYAILKARANMLWILAIATKIVAEQSGLLEKYDFFNLTNQLIEHPVVIDAHLWGAAGGLLFFGALRLYKITSLLIEVNSDKHHP